MKRQLPIVLWRQPKSSGDTNILTDQVVGCRSCGKDVVREGLAVVSYSSNRVVCEFLVYHPFCYMNILQTSFVRSAEKVDTIPFRVVSLIPLGCGVVSFRGTPSYKYRSDVSCFDVRKLGGASVVPKRGLVSMRADRNKEVGFVDGRALLVKRDDEYKKLEVKE